MREGRKVGSRFENIGWLFVFKIFVSPTKAADSEVLIEGYNKLPLVSTTL